MTTRLYIFDADGTLRMTTVRGQPCPHAEDEWRLLDGVRERLHSLDAPLAVASNQDHIGYGLLAESIARQLLRSMMLAASGRVLPDEALELCPHRPDQRCRCRKPAPLMIERLLARFAIPPARALFIGDNQCDRAAAEAAGVRFQWAREFFAVA